MKAFTMTNYHKFEDPSSDVHDSLLRKRREHSYQLGMIFEALDYDRESSHINAYTMRQFQKSLINGSQVFLQILQLSQRNIEDIIQKADLSGGLHSRAKELEKLIESIDEILEISRAEIVLCRWALESEPLSRKTSPFTSFDHAEVGKRVIKPSIEAGKLEVIQRIQTKYDEYFKVIKHLTAGGIAGAVSRTSVSPLERMKILFQVQGPGVGQYQGIIPSFLKILREEGVLGYFKGNGTNIIRIVPYSAIQFASYERYKKFLLRHDQQDLSTAQRLLAGACAGITSVVCTYPLDLVRTRLSVQTSSKKYHGVWHCTKIIYAEEGGFRALFRGLSPTVMGIAPYVALNFTVYETLKGWLRDNFGEPSVLQKLLCGAIAGTTAQTSTYPLDVIRRRMQLAGMKGTGFGYSSTFNAIKTIARQEGIRGLYKGMLPNILKVAPAISVSFVTYEAMKKLLRTN